MFELYWALAGLRTAVIRDIDERAADLARLVEVSPGRVLPVLVFAYEVHGDAGRADEIAARNGVRHPGFIGPEALVVKAAGG